jgi:hypothetical protein
MDKVEIQIAYHVTFTFDTLDSERVSEDDEFDISKFLSQNISPSKKHLCIGNDKITFYRRYEPENIEFGEINHADLYVHFLVSNEWFMSDRNNVIETIRDLGVSPLTIKTDFNCGAYNIKIHSVRLSNISMPPREGVEGEFDVIDF